MYIVAVSIVMGWIITMERLPHEAAKAIQLYIEHPLLALLIINVLIHEIRPYDFFYIILLFH